MKKAVVPEPTTGPKLADPRKVRTRRIVIGGILLFIIATLVIPVSHRVKADFTVVPLASEHVRAMTAGYLVEIRVKAGDRVVPGQVLAVLEDEALRTRAEIARLEVSIMEGQLASLIGPTQDAARERKRLDLERARSNAHTLAERVDALVLRSTIEGIVLTQGLANRIGDYVARGREVIHILEPGTVRLDLLLEETDVTRISRGDPADIHFVALPGERYTGNVSAVVPLQDVAEIEQSARSPRISPKFKAYIDITNPTDQLADDPATLAAGAAIFADASGSNVLSLGRFRPGMSGQAYIVVGRRSLASHFWATVTSMLRSDLLFV